MFSLTYCNSPMLQNKNIKRTAKDVQHRMFVNLFMDCKATNRQIKQKWVKYINTLKLYEYFSEKDM